MSETQQPKSLKAQIEVWIAAVLMVVSFAVGFFIRGIVTEDEPTPTPVQGQIPGMPAGVVAPPLTDQQLTGGLPAGHVPVDPSAQSPNDPDNDGDNDANPAQNPDQSKD